MDPVVLEKCVQRVYSTFSHPEIAPLVPISDHWSVLELFHGPTLAFEDFALQLLGNFMRLKLPVMEKN